MAVDAQHTEYTLNAGDWKLCRDAIAGSKTVKAAGPAYLPKLEGQSFKEYDAYKMRASYFNATGRTVDGIVGMIFRKDPSISGSNDKQLLATKVSKDGKKFSEFLRAITGEIVGMGRVGVLIDAPSNGEAANKAYFAEYQAEAILNWQTHEVNGEEQLSLVVLKEDLKIDGEDEFEKETVSQIRVLRIVQGVYQVQIYKQLNAVSTVYTAQEPVFPKIAGRSLNSIPFKFIVPSGTSIGKVEKSPIIDIAEINMSHYRSSADLEHGRHFTGLPTAWAAGFPKDTVLRIGSGVAWISEDPTATARYLEFTGQGLGALVEALKEKNRQMTILGARLLEESNPKAAEATETHRLRKSGENNIVANIAKSISGAATELLNWLSEWRTDLSGGYTIDLNTDYVQTKMTSDELIALVKSLQDGAISEETFVWNLKQGEILPDHLEVADEIEKLKKNMKEKEDAEINNVNTE